MQTDLNDKQFLSLFGMEREQQFDVLYNTYWERYKHLPIGDVFSHSEMSLIVKHGYIALHLASKEKNLVFEDEPIILYSRASKLLRARIRKDWDMHTIEDQTFFYNQIRKQKIITI